MNITFLDTSIASYSTFSHLRSKYILLIFLPYGHRRINLAALYYIYYIILFMPLAALYYIYYIVPTEVSSNPFLKHWPILSDKAQL